MDRGSRKAHIRKETWKIRRTAAHLAALALVFSLALPWSGPARAERSVFFVAADEIVLPLSDDTMPFWEGGYLYISAGIFTDSVAGGAARRNLDIGMIQNSDQDRVTLYRGKDSLDFEMGVNFAVDPDGEIYYPGAIWRNGRVFVSAHLAADYFGLLYSVIAVEHGSLVWLRHRSFRLQEQAFADAASYQLNTTYQEYLDAKSPPPAPSETPDPPAPVSPPTPVSPPLEPARQSREDGTRTVPTEPAEPTEPAPEPDPEPDPEPEPPPEPAIPGGVELYLCLRAGENTSALLDILDASGIRAAFFCDRAFLEQQGDLVRRMAASGHSVGLDLTGTGGEGGGPGGPDVPRPLAEQAAALGELTERAACLHTRLAFVENGTDADREALRALGYVCPVQFTSTPISRREALLREAGGLGGRAAVWLGDVENTSDLGKLLDDVMEVEDRCLPLTETTFL